MCQFENACVRRMCPLHMGKEYQADVKSAMPAIFKLLVHKVRVSCIHTSTEVSCSVSRFCVQRQAVLIVYALSSMDLSCKTIST